MQATAKRTGILPLLLTAAALGACDQSPMGPQDYAWAGTYATATKFGGANGTWRAADDLEITGDRRVFVAATEIVNPQVGENSVSWSMADGNATNAAFDLMPSSTSAYFWDGNGAAGKLFQGWIQFPGQGKLDYRGQVK